MSYFDYEFIILFFFTPVMLEENLKCKIFQNLNLDFKLKIGRNVVF